MLLRALGVFFLLPALFGCAPATKADAPKASPAKVTNLPNEQNLTTITLTPEAEKRLGIQPVPAEWKDVQRYLSQGGEVMFPPGQAATVTAPVSGTLSVPEGAQAPAAGEKIQQGQPVLTLLPLLSPERAVLTPTERVQLAESRVSLARAQVEADEQYQSALVRVEAARIALGRVEDLLASQAATQRTVDEARANFSLAEKSLEASRTRKELLDKTVLDAEAGAVVPHVIAAPVSGVLISVDAVAGETVVAGSPLFQVARLDRMWVRVPVYVGQWREIQAGQAVQVTEFGQRSGAPAREGRPIPSPPSADPNAATVDLIYEVANEDGRLWPGQRVVVRLPLGDREKSLVIPWSAVVFDIYGGAWVYENVAPQTFVRRRVEVRRVDGAQAVLAAGLQAGAAVVAEGAVELFGTEFGFGK